MDLLEFRSGKWGNREASLRSTRRLFVMPPKKGKADDRPPIFLAIDKGDDEAVEELLKDDPGNLNIRNKVRTMIPPCSDESMRRRRDSPADESFPLTLPSLIRTDGHR